MKEEWRHTCGGCKCCVL